MSLTLDLRSTGAGHDAGKLQYACLAHLGGELPHKLMMRSLVDSAILHQ